MVLISEVLISGFHCTTLNCSDWNILSDSGPMMYKKVSLLTSPSSLFSLAALTKRLYSRSHAGHSFALKLFFSADLKKAKRDDRGTYLTSDTM